MKLNVKRGKELLAAVIHHELGKKFAQLHLILAFATLTSVQHNKLKEKRLRVAQTRTDSNGIDHRQQRLKLK